MKKTQNLITLSLLVNCIVLIPVCFLLLIDHPRIVDVFGESTPARGVLLSIYTAILLSSIALVYRKDTSSVSTLLFIQVLYKITTPFTVGDIQNPVVIANLIVAGIHTVTLLSIAQQENVSLFKK